MLDIINDINANFSREQLIYGAIALGIACIVLHGLFKNRQLRTKIDDLQNDLLVANSNAIGMGQKLLSLEKKLHQQDRRASNNKPLQNHTEKPQKKTTVPLKVVKSATAKQSAPYFNQPANTVEDDAYEQSRQLLAQGHNIQEVIKQSGLSYSEVSLIKALSK